MKKVMLLLIAGLAVVVPAQANLLVNGDFEDGPIGEINVVGLPGWEFWAGQYTLYHHSDTERTLDEKACAIFWTDAGVGQYFDAEAGVEYTLGVSMLSSTSTDTYNGQPANMYGKDDVLSVEWYDGSGVIIGQTIEVDRFEGGVDPDDVWTLISGNVVAPAGAAQGMLVISQVVTDASNNGGGAHFDNAFVVKAGQATSPSPADGATVSTELDTISWQNAAETATVDVWFGTVGEPNSLIADDIAAETLSLSAPPIGSAITLASGEVYEWKVDSKDSSGNVVEGTWWTFNTGNMAPIADAGEDQYIWLENGQAQVILTGSVQDDGMTEGYTVSWSLDAAESDPATTVVIDPNDVETTTVTIDGEGWYTLKFTADDGMYTDEDFVAIGVYDSPCTAAKEDPADPYNNYPNGLHGDLDGDCDTDLDDFAILAATWLDCMSPKMGCL
ncbi:hypothetical protein STSP2_02320 [Anaerohalosphaera lusitana]|uniref:Uncharacterized protein n=1 Tax=Anaerohalosphaera lusitana TaxID=1936003 RepID=A0A1U9NMJ6_9BACT|nr:hypothetical protein [Anaerohalosphaera lusitana]AQT69133.1 hypothetical protein STSP2_02320 [Anaerohalosphaera lusitana]